MKIILTLWTPERVLGTSRGRRANHSLRTADLMGIQVSPQKAP